MFSLLIFFVENIMTIEEFVHVTFDELVPFVVEIKFFVVQVF